MGFDLPLWGELGIDILIIVGGFTGTFLFFFIVSLLNMKLGYTIFELYIGLGLIVLVFALLMNVASGSLVPNSFFIAGIIPLFIYFSIAKRRESLLNSKTLTK
jgi:hypothetical protein